jgi:5-methylcytosine-specific restriction endonuclease McrA
MIFVDRNLTPAPAILANGGNGQLEKEAAIEHHRKKSPSDTKAFPFTVYKHPTIKKALHDLFHGKCAYCESFYAKTQPMDVEHWRPKAAIETARGKKIKPGYYWLASDWDNLLPSCIHCNRASYHLVPPDYAKPLKLGKENRFPLRDEKKRARKPGDEIYEEPLLLNPCRDRPEEFITFPFDDTRCGIVQPRFDGEDNAKLRAEISIEIYALNREPLVKERKRRFLEIAYHLKNVELLTIELDAARDNASRQRFEARLRDEFIWLEKSKGAEEPYSQLARQFVDTSLNRLQS